MFDCYRKEMAVNVEDIENILVAVLSGDEKEIYKALNKKKEIDDKSPNLRTVDEKNMLKSLSNKMRKFPKDLIDGIKKKFPDLQRTPVLERSTRRYIGMALRGALYSLCYLLFVVCM